MRDEERTQKSSCEMESAFYHFVSYSGINFLIKSWQMHAQTLHLEAMTCAYLMYQPGSNFNQTEP